MGSESYGAWLARQMERRGVSVRQVADALDVTTKTVYYWRGGKTEVSEERIPQLATVLGVTETEARRGLGYWLPSSEDAPLPVLDRSQLRETARRLRQQADDLDRLSEALPE